MLNNIAPAVRKETKRVAIMTLIGVILMIVVFCILHQIWPDYIPFDYTVFLGGIVGGIVGVANFFLMGLTVQDVANTTDEELARSKMRASYMRRSTMQLFWAVIAIIAPCFQFMAGILPILFPSAGLKILAILGKVE